MSAASEAKTPKANFRLSIDIFQLPFQQRSELATKGTSMKKIRVGLVGISGYTGMELARLLAFHPSMSLVMACSRTEAGRRLGDFYPFLRSLPGGDVQISVFNPKIATRDCDIVFLAVPAGSAMRMAADLLREGVKVVDFSADFRLNDPAEYQEWYKRPHEQKELLAEAVYGLPELNGEKIAKARLTANPGCYPTASILALYPLLKNRLIDPDSIIIDAASGASGAGRKAAIPNLFCEISDDFRAYGAPGHRHTPEIEQELGKISASRPVITFTPHLVPMKRGILATIYAKPAREDLTQVMAHEAMAAEWRGKPWIRLLPQGELPRTINVRGSMFCDIAVAVDSRAKRLLVFSAIDNLCRGASGQALANANLMSGLPMEAGLENLAPLL